MMTDTTVPSYWLNWRFLLCAISILAALIAAAIIIWKYEGFNGLRSRKRDNQVRVGSLHKDEVWGTCWTVIHPAWLLAYRVIVFCLLLAMLIANAVIDGGGIFYFYTQWTFALVTLYFGVGVLFSLHGCCMHHDKDGVDLPHHVSSDEELGTNTASTVERSRKMPRNWNEFSETYICNTASICGYGFQIIFQVCAGSVVLTDCVFWIVIYPFLTNKYFKLDFLTVGMHSVNAVFLLGDVMLNKLKFPFFRIAYFALWTCIYVVFQWIVHAFVSMRWPYPFLDLSSAYAPMWYLGVGFLIIPCYGVFAVIVKGKELCVGRLSGVYDGH